MDYSPWGGKELYMTEPLTHTHDDSGNVKKKKIPWMEEPRRL